MTYDEALKWGKSRLETVCNIEKDADAWQLFEFVAKMDRTKFFMERNEEISEDIFEKYKRCINKRKEHYPVQYITNIQSFMGFDFYVDESVLVPRPETEELVVCTENLLSKRFEERKGGLQPFAGSPDVLDMCTGSGCIAISLKLRNDNINVTGVDISNEALNVAVRNCEQLNAKVSFVQSDLFSVLEERGVINDRFDIIVSNPPYIETKEIETLMSEVKDYEPVIALDGCEDGLYFYRKIVEQSVNYLKSGGYLIFEIGCSQGEAVSKIMRDNGFSNIEVRKDLSGLDRIVFGGI